MSYTYINGIYEVTTPIHNGFKRFHSMNAQVAYTYDDIFDADEWDFVSYAMPVAMVYHERRDNKWYVYIAADALIQSRTTNRQIARFLREIGSPFTVNELRDLIESGHVHKVDDKHNRVMNVSYDVNTMFEISFYN